MACLTFDTYTWYAGKTSSAENLGERQPEASPEELMAACDANKQCAGFTTDGWLKAAGGQLVEFDGAGVCDGYYAAQLDPSAQGEADWAWRESTASAGLVRWSSEAACSLPTLAGAPQQCSAQRASY